MNHIIFIYFMFWMAGNCVKLLELKENEITKLKILDCINPLNGFYFLIDTCWVIGFLIKKFWNLPLK
jgi:hypothetical protein